MDDFYTKIDFLVSDKLSFYGDLQFRKIYYEANITPYSVITGYVEEGYNSIDKVFTLFLEPIVESSLTLNFGTKNKLIPFVPEGPPGILAKTK